VLVALLAVRSVSSQLRAESRALVGAVLQHLESAKNPELARRLLVEHCDRNEVSAGVIATQTGDVEVLRWLHKLCPEALTQGSRPALDVAYLALRNALDAVPPDGPASDADAPTRWRRFVAVMDFLTDVTGTPLATDLESALALARIARVRSMARELATGAVRAVPLAVIHDMVPVPLAGADAAVPSPFDVSRSLGAIWSRVLPRLHHLAPDEWAVLLDEAVRSNCVPLVEARVRDITEDHLHRAVNTESWGVVAAVMRHIVDTAAADRDGAGTGAEHGAAAERRASHRRMVDIILWGEFEPLVPPSAVTVGAKSPDRDGPSADLVSVAHAVLQAATALRADGVRDADASAARLLAVGTSGKDVVAAAAEVDPVAVFLGFLIPLRHKALELLVRAVALSPLGGTAPGSADLRRQPLWLPLGSAADIAAAQPPPPVAFLPHVIVRYGTVGQLHALTGGDAAAPPVEAAAGDSTSLLALRDGSGRSAMDCILAGQAAGVPPAQRAAMAAFLVRHGLMPALPTDEAALSDEHTRTYASLVFALLPPSAVTVPPVGAAAPAVAGAAAAVPASDVPDDALRPLFTHPLFLRLLVALLERELALPTQSRQGATDVPQSGYALWLTREAARVLKLDYPEAALPLAVQQRRNHTLLGLVAGYRNPAAAAADGSDDDGSFHEQHHADALEALFFDLARHAPAVGAAGRPRITPLMRCVEACDERFTAHLIARGATALSPTDADGLSALEQLARLTASPPSEAHAACALPVLRCLLRAVDLAAVPPPPSSGASSCVTDAAAPADVQLAPPSRVVRAWTLLVRASGGDGGSACLPLVAALEGAFPLLRERYAPLVAAPGSRHALAALPPQALVLLTEPELADVAFLPLRREALEGELAKRANAKARREADDAAPGNAAAAAKRQKRLQKLSDRVAETERALSVEAAAEAEVAARLARVLASLAAGGAVVAFELPAGAPSPAIAATAATTTAPPAAAPLPPIPPEMVQDGPAVGTVPPPLAHTNNDGNTYDDPALAAAAALRSPTMTAAAAADSLRGSHLVLTRLPDGWRQFDPDGAPFREGTASKLYRYVEPGHTLPTIVLKESKDTSLSSHGTLLREFNNAMYLTCNVGPHRNIVLPSFFMCTPRTDHNGRVVNTARIGFRLYDESLGEWVQRHGANPQRHPALSTRVKLLQDVAAGMSYIQLLAGTGRVMHRDLHSNNVLLDGDVKNPDAVPVAAVHDFGHAKVFNHTAHLTIGHMSIAGIAPETLTTTGGTQNPDGSVSYKVEHNEAVDVYHFGSLIHELLAMRAPFARLLPNDIQKLYHSRQAQIDHLNTLRAMCEGDGESADAARAEEATTLTALKAQHPAWPMTRLRAEAAHLVAAHIAAGGTRATYLPPRAFLRSEDALALDDPLRATPTGRGLLSLMERCLAERPGDRPRCFADVLGELQVLLPSLPTARPHQMSTGQLRTWVHWVGQDLHAQSSKARLQAPDVVAAVLGPCGGVWPTTLPGSADGPLLAFARQAETRASARSRSSTRPPRRATPASIRRTPRPPWWTWCACCAT
jgi:hypothetical protein